MAQHDAHVFTHRKFFTRNVVMLDQPRAFQDVGPGLLQVRQLHLRKPRLQRLLDRHLRPEKVAAELRHGVQGRRRQLGPFVFDQSAHQLRTRVFRLLAFGHLARWQQHARLDLDQHRRHQKIFGRQFQVAPADLVHVHQVLPRHAGHRNIQDIEVLLADQVQQQIQRAFEGLQEYFERIRRDVQILGHREQRLAIQTGQRDLIHHLGHVRGLRRNVRSRHGRRYYFAAVW